MVHSFNHIKNATINANYPMRRIETVIKVNTLSYPHFSQSCMKHQCQAMVAFAFIGDMILDESSPNSSSTRDNFWE